MAAACAQGVVRLFSCKSLAFRATLPRFVARGQGPAAGAGEQRDARLNVPNAERLVLAVLHLCAAVNSSTCSNTHQSSSTPCVLSCPVTGAAAEEGFPDARACSFRPETEQQLVVVYADMSMIVWDIQDLKKVSRHLQLHLLLASGYGTLNSFCTPEARLEEPYCAVCQV